MRSYKVNFDGKESGAYFGDRIMGTLTFPSKVVFRNMRYWQ